MSENLQALSRKQEILIVDRDEPTRDVLERLFDYEGYRALGTGSIAETRAMMAWRQPDLVVVDIDLPDGNGLDLVGDLRDRHGLAVIIYSDRSSDADVIAGLSQGADDFIAKPCGGAELLARIRAVLRRGCDGKNQYDARVACFAGFVLDYARQMLFRDGGHPMKLSKSAFCLLKTFLENPSRVFSQDQLLETLWPGREDIKKGAVRTEVSRLRQTLDDRHQTPPLIASIRGEGYIFRAEVTWGPIN